MHESAKLNVFFGVPNLGEEMLPAHLRYLATYHDAAADEHVLSVLGDDLDRGDGAGSLARGDPAPTHFDAIGYTMLGYADDVGGR